MKIKHLSFLLALVMALSAFAGTFTVSAEGEEAAVNAWEVGGQTYADWQEAIDAANPGDTIYLIADYTQPNIDIMTNKDLTIEGRLKADGNRPVLTHTPNWEVISIGISGEPENGGTVLFKGFDIVTVGLKQSASIYVRQGNNLIMEDMNIVFGVGTAAHYITKGFVRFSGNDINVTFKNCKFTCPEGAAPVCNPGVVSADSSARSGNTAMFDECEIDFSMAAKPYYLYQSRIETAASQTLILRNTTVKTPEGVDYPIAQGELPHNGTGETFQNQTEFTGTVDYRGTNVINGVTTVTADVDYLIYDNKAREAGYVARVGEVKDAIKLDEQGNVEFIGYYKDLVAACNAAAATETEKQKEVFLIDNVTVTENLTIPSATIDGQNKTLTAPRIYKAVDAILNVTALNIVTTSENPILQMNGDSEPAEGEEAPAPSYAKFTKCTFTTNQKVPYAYFVLQADLTLDRCTINITNAECDKPIFRMDKGADVTFAGSELDVSETAPKLVGFDVVNDGGTVITFKGNTEFTLAQGFFTAGSKANTTLVVNERSSLTSTEEDAIVLGADQTGWVLTLGGTATVSALKGSAFTIAAPNTTVTVGGNAKVSGASRVLYAKGAGVTFSVAPDATVELISHARNKAAVSLEGEDSKLISEGTITALKTTATVYSIELVGAKASALIKGGTLNNAVLVGTETAAGAFVMTAGKVVAQEKAASAIILTNGSADILSGTLSGAPAAISGQKSVTYPEGTTEIKLNELYDSMPLTVGTSMRMNDGSLGMRFTSSAEAAVVAYADALKASGAVLDYEFGTLIVRATEIRGREMTVAALAAENVVYAAVKAEAGLVKAEDGSVTYTAAVINFTEDNMGTSLVARAYIKYTLIDGSVLYVYAAENTEGVSLGELAQQCLADVSDKSVEGYRNQVQEFYEADEDGWYELVEETAYSPYSKEQQEALKLIVENAEL